MCDEKGIYYAHEPIYGFRKGHSEPGLIDKYVNTLQIMRALSHLEFASLLDVGAAEGYKAFIAKKLFGMKVECSDLSETACKRAEELWGIDSIPADIHSLPFKNAEYDVVLCSETLEHIADLSKAVDELLRVASKAVVITVPHEPKYTIDKNIKERVPHGHIRSFDLESFNFLKLNGYGVYSKKMLSSLLRISRFLIGAMPLEHYDGGYPKTLIDIYNSAVPLLVRVPFGKKAAVFLVRLDDFACKFSHRGILFVILKDNKCWRNEVPNISVYDIINFAVPYHYLRVK